MFKHIILGAILVSMIMITVDKSDAAFNKVGWLTENTAFVGRFTSPLDDYSFPLFTDFGPSFYAHVSKVINALNTAGYSPFIATSSFITSIWSYVVENETPYTTGDAKVTGLYSAIVQASVDPNSILYNEDSADRVDPVYYQFIQIAAKDYTNSLTAFTAAPSNPTTALYLRVAIDKLESLLTTVLADGGEFRRHPLDQLTIFSLAATSHVLLLTDLVRWGETWGFSTQNVTTYRDTYYEVIDDYSHYARDVFDEANTPMTNLGNFDGSGRFDNFQDLRRIVITQVSDFVAMWYNLDPKIAGLHGFHAERVRYLFSKTIGYSVDPDMISSENISDYVSPSFERLTEMWWGLKQEDYKGEMTSFLIVHKPDEIIYSAQPTYTTSRPATPASTRKGAEVGTLVAEPGVTKNKNFKFPPTSVTQNASFHHDHLPRRLVFPGVGGLALDRGCLSNDEYCQTFYGEIGQRITDNIAVPDHKIGTAFGWGTNERTTLHPALDAITVGLIPSNVFANNVILRATTTVIDAQKYQSIDGGAYFEPETFGPGLHSMFIPVGGSITYRFDSVNAVDIAYDLYLRVYTGSKVPLSVKVSKNGVDVATFTLPFLNKNSIVETTPDYDIVLSPNHDNNLFTFTAVGSNVRLTSIILVPK
ncbi:hypothetical protein SAMD00019534_001240 [Acytostelium subglobosum LB1]|uniref:hypothetical protein n=1 Tax=Acytostelium subglobosum LB1 TaxID=1410327 RepID=UPI0006449F91|nr:hypothetical protein SAMD00019534_001240 [Acytostelium subglobosum LB1]GAM16949.1 hypothetical protein SAMD00019534_001240 [Acytostelium subglobosum LB1]|eukprot:XP_012759011.1 hypothetical protein SAMD00019534_001240 [Acytostelium subglobosum LB1]